MAQPSTPTVRFALGGSAKVRLKGIRHPFLPEARPVKEVPNEFFHPEVFGFVGLVQARQLVHDVAGTGRRSPAVPYFCRRFSILRPAAFFMLLSVASVRSFRPRPYHAAAAVFFAIAAAVFYLPYLSALPTSIHTWAQSDRLSLAINFYDYGFHLFTPRTSSLVSIGGVTGVEFPIQAYLAALGGLVFGRGSIITLYRLLDVLAVSMGFYYMFRLVYEHTGNFVAGLVPGAFLLGSPFFAFYAGSFMPDPFSLSISFIGYYYWLRFFDDRHFADLRWAVLLLTLAGLVKTTTALHFGAVVGFTVLWSFLEPELLLPKERRQLLLLAGLGFGAILGMFLRNQYLNETYASWQFISTTNPIPDDEALHTVLQNVWRYHVHEYATIAQYRTLIVCLVLFVVFLRANLRRYRPLVLLLGASVVIAYVFVKIMGAGLGVHDYHMICAFIPPALLLLILALLNLGRFAGPARYATGLGFGVLVFFLVANGYKRLHRRMSDDYPPFSPWGHIWMRGGAEEMRQAKVPEAATILIVNELAINIGQVYFDRRGVAWRPDNLQGVTADDLLNRMASNKLDYAVMSQESYATLAPQHAALAAAFETVARQPAVILRRRDTARPW